MPSSAYQFVAEQHRAAPVLHASEVITRTCVHGASAWARIECMLRLEHVGEARCLPDERQFVRLGLWPLMITLVHLRTFPVVAHVSL